MLYIVSLNQIQSDSAIHDPHKALYLALQWWGIFFSNPPRWEGGKGRVKTTWIPKGWRPQCHSYSCIHFIWGILAFSMILVVLDWKQATATGTQVWRVWREGNFPQPQFFTAVITLLGVLSRILSMSPHASHSYLQLKRQKRKVFFLHTSCILR